MIINNWPVYSQQEIDTVTKVLKSGKVNYWTGNESREFEQEFAKFSETTFAIALSNGTVALDTALHALDIGHGDEVIVTSRTFLASVSSIVNSGADPVFADVDPDTQNIDFKTIHKVLTDKTKAIICVHLAGWPCDMDPIIELAAEHGLFVIEDCAQAHGAKYKGKSVGSFGDIGCWSFCQDKIMTTGGEGGMVTTNDRKLWSKMWSYKDHGKNWEKVYKKNHPPGFRWLHDAFGTNYRMTEMQAAIGRIQLQYMPNWSNKRRKNAELIWQTARNTPGLRAPNLFNTGYLHAAYKCYIFVNGLEVDRDTIMAKINNKGIPCSSGSCSEVYLEKAFDNTGLRPKNRLPIARQLGETSLMFLCHPTLTDQDIIDTCAVLREVATDHFLNYKASK